MDTAKHAKLFHPELKAIYSEQWTSGDFEPPDMDSGTPVKLFHPKPKDPFTGTRDKREREAKPPAWIQTAVREGDELTGVQPSLSCNCVVKKFTECRMPLLFSTVCTLFQKKKKLSSQTTYHCHWNPNTNCARANLRILQGHKSRFTVWPVPEQTLSNWFVGNEFLITPQSPAISFLWNYSLPVNMNNNVLAKHLLQQTHVQYLNSTSIL